MEATLSSLQESAHDRGSQRALPPSQIQRQLIRPDLHRRSFSKYGTEAAGLVRRSASVFAISLCPSLRAQSVAACGMIVAYWCIVYAFFRLVCNSQLVSLNHSYSMWAVLHTGNDIFQAMILYWQW